MPTYRVIRQSDGRTVYAYTADAPVNFAEYPFSTHAHVEEVAIRSDGAVEADPTWLITKRSFWNRLPPNNEVALRAIINSGSPALLAASLQRLQARVDASPFVDLKLAETIGGVQWLASTEVPATVSVDGVTLPLRLTAEQADAILNTVPSASEVWSG